MHRLCPPHRVVGRKLTVEYPFKPNEPNVCAARTSRKSQILESSL
jgi:hypothetical protein